MVLMVACGLLLLTGLVLGVRWSGRPFQSPPPLDEPSAVEVARRFCWYYALVLLGGVGAGIPLIGAGGRLAMRLLAVTAGDDAQGRVTEAEQVVGKITTGGTIGFILFEGIIGGIAAGALYLLARRLLPAGRLGGIAFGAGLLVVLGTSLDPLREENPDFDIVGPGWVAVLVFTVMALAFGLVLAAFMARLSTWLPLPAWERAVLLRYAPVLPLAALGFTVTAFVVVVGLSAVLVTRWAPLGRAVRSPTMVLLGRVGLVALVALSLVGAVESMANIATGSA